ncbi:MAG: DUF4142 domain-containing protein [Ramlibacter sp.]
MKCVSHWVAAAIVVIVGAGSAHAQQDGEPALPSERDASAPAVVRTVPRPPMFAAASAANAQRLTAQQREEWRFLKEAAAASRFEGDAARLALGRSTDPRVRAFATTLISHQASAGNELLHLLHVRGMAAPMLTNGQRKTLNRLGKLQGVKFDREFVEQVGLRYQQDDVRVYEKASTMAGEPRLKAWIDRTLPSMREHMAIAGRIASLDSKQAKEVNSFVSRVSTQSMSAGPAPLGAPAR